METVWESWKGEGEVIAHLNFIHFIYQLVRAPWLPGQFNGPWYISQPAKFIGLVNLKSFLSIWTQRYNMCLSNLVFSVLTVSYETSFFPPGLCMADGKQIGPKLTVRTSNLVIHTFASVRPLQLKNYSPSKFSLWFRYRYLKPTTIPSQFIITC